MGEGQRERETQNRKQAPGSERAISPEPDAGLELPDREIVTWLKSDALPTAPPRRPSYFFFCPFSPSPCHPLCVKPLSFFSAPVTFSSPTPGWLPDGGLVLCCIFGFRDL